MAKKEEEVKVQVEAPKKRGPKPKQKDAESNVATTTAKTDGKVGFNKKAISPSEPPVKTFEKEVMSPVGEIPETSQPSIVSKEEAIETATENLDELLDAINDKLNAIEDTTDNLVETGGVIDQLQSDVKELSEQAQKWAKWLKLHGITPQRFLEKYASHPARKFVEELYKNG